MSSITAGVPSDKVAQAWVNFNGTGTVAITRAFNVSSITDLGVGNYDVNFDNALQTADYPVVANAGDTAAAPTNANVNVGGYLTTKFNIACAVMTTAARGDRSAITAVVFGGG